MSYQHLSKQIVDKLIHKLYTRLILCLLLIITTVFSQNHAIQQLGLTGEIKNL
jgi:hypothetical protein